MPDTVWRSTAQRPEGRGGWRGSSPRSAHAVRTRRVDHQHRTLGPGHAVTRYRRARQPVAVGGANDEHVVIAVGVAHEGPTGRADHGGGYDVYVVRDATHGLVERGRDRVGRNPLQLVVLGAEPSPPVGVEGPRAARGARPRAVGPRRPRRAVRDVRRGSPPHRQSPDRHWPVASQAPPLPPST